MRGERIAAALIDFLIISVFQGVAGMIFVMLPLIRGQQSTADFIMGRMLCVTACSAALLVLRDCLPGGSPGKHALHLCVAEKATGRPASLWRRLVRNIPLLLNWIEIIIFLASGTRLGDLLARTTVQKKPTA